ncbi:hypothetical protein MLD38_029658 [Melastoma candidum]|uniref:Uncharacterized protein n=1 Tax=Melastoma candidum TaxID=119954 RepID=A0ACB9N4L9_9MYRT|nr:hypothetical protein MLD38_029658 [Melastoma candidum]
MNPSHESSNYCYYSITTLNLSILFSLWHRPTKSSYFDIGPVGLFAQIGAFKCGKEVDAYALRNGMESDGYLPTATLDMYVRWGETGRARNFFDMQEKDVASWNAEREEGMLAVEMGKSGVYPDKVMFPVLSCACSRSVDG